MSTRYAYLACPYTSDREREQERYEVVTKAAALLAAHGLKLYSPITQTHPMHIEAPEWQTEMTHQEWMEFDKPFLMNASLLVVCCMPGWEDSRGVKIEIALFERLKRPILYLHSDDFNRMRS